MPDKLQSPREILEHLLLHKPNGETEFNSMIDYAFLALNSYYRMKKDRKKRCLNCKFYPCMRVVCLYEADKNVKPLPCKKFRRD